MAARGSSALNFIGVTNVWLVMDVIYNGTSGLVYTNGVLAASGNIGTKACTNLVLNNANTLANGAAMNLAEMITWGGGASIPGTNSTARAQLYYYLTNKWGVPGT